jgi:branched-chain amino acid transport system permease protein
MLIVNKPFYIAGIPEHAKRWARVCCCFRRKFNLCENRLGVMVDPLLSGALIFSSLLSLLSIGLTLTYMTTKVPNFAHASLAAVGAYVTLTTGELLGGSPYLFLPFAFVIGGLVGLVQYRIIFKPLIRRGVNIIGLMVATLAMEFIFLSILNIYADSLSKELKVRSRYFLLAIKDFEFAGIPGLLIVASILVVLTATTLYLFLTKTKFGIAIRAAIEDPALASVVGVNVNRVYAVSWLIAGALGVLSGALLPLWFPGNPDMGSRLIVSVFAASIIGGLGNVYGAVLGGFVIGFAELLGTNFLATQFGPWVIPYRPLIPLAAIVITLLLAPQGLLGVDWRGLATRLRKKSIGHLRFKHLIAKRKPK